MHASESQVKQHPDYADAKSGGIVAAQRLVDDLLSVEAIQRLRSLTTAHSVKIVPVHALETHGVNEIPTALATRVAEELGFELWAEIVQTNTVGHTGADGFHRLANQAEFAGSVSEGVYVVIDDFVGQGGTLANMIGHIHAHGGTVAGATVLTGKPYSASIALDDAALTRLRGIHGQKLEDWWKEQFGFGFDCLTRSEARYLENTPDADAIRDRLVAARSQRGD
jgi:hypothetical protein